MQKQKQYSVFKPHITSVPLRPPHPPTAVLKGTTSITRTTVILSTEFEVMFIRTLTPALEESKVHVLGLGRRLLTEGRAWIISKGTWS